MNANEKMNLIEKRIGEFYNHILLRPQILCRPVEIEAFVLALREYFGLSR